MEEWEYKTSTGGQSHHLSSSKEECLPTVQSNNIPLHTKLKTAIGYTDQYCWVKPWVRWVHRHRKPCFSLLSSVSVSYLPHTCCAPSFINVWVLTSWQTISFSRNFMQSVTIRTTTLAAPTYQTRDNILVSVTRCPVEGCVLAVFAVPRVDTDPCRNQLAHTANPETQNYHSSVSFPYRTIYNSRV